MKNQKGFTLIGVLGVFFVVTLLLVVSFFVYKHERKDDVIQTANCKPSQSMVESGMYDVPCSLIVLLSGPPYADKTTLQNAVKPIEASVYSIVPEDGIYGVKVRGGTEEKSIDFLKEQPIIESVRRDTCCYGPNAATNSQQ